MKNMHAEQREHKELGRNVIRKKKYPQTQISRYTIHPTVPFKTYF